MYRTYNFPWYQSPDGYLWETPSGSAGAGGAGSQSGSPSGGSPSSGTPQSSSSGAPPSSGAGTGGQDPVSPANRGPVDFARFEEVNNRVNKLKWAEQYEDPEEVSQATQLYRWFDQDPVGAYQYLTGLMERQGHIQKPQAPSAPAHRDRFTAQDGRPLPDVIIQETGQRFYSAEQSEKLVEWANGKLNERLTAIEARGQSTQAREDARNAIAEAERTWPHFTDFAEDIFKELNRDKRLSLEGAYRRVVIPKIKQKEREAVVAEMRTKGQAGTGTHNPQSQSPSETAELKKLPLTELFRREMQRRGLGR